VKAPLINLDVNRRLKDGGVALHVAVRDGNKAIVELLLSMKGIDTSVAHPSDGTPMEIASRLPTAISVPIQGLLERQKKKLSRGGSFAVSEMAGPGEGGVMAGAAPTPGRKQNPLGRERVIPSFAALSSTREGEDWEIDTVSHPESHTEGVCAALSDVMSQWNSLMDTTRRGGSAATTQSNTSLRTAKSSAATAIMKCGSRLVVEGDESRQMVLDVIQRLLEEGETDAESVRLLRVLLFRVVSIDFSPMIDGKGWAGNAASGGHPDILDTLLSLPKMWKEESTIEVVRNCVNHATKQVPLLLVCLRHDENLRFGTHKNHLRPIWQEAFEMLMEPSRRLQPGSEARLELLYRIALHPHISLQTEHEFGGSHTFFSRACRDGDTAGAKMMLDTGLVRDINRVHTNKSTALMQAVVGNGGETVQMLCRDPFIDLLVSSPHGTALELAVKLKRDPTLIDVLRQATEAQAVL